MATFAVEITIDTPIQEVWRALSDIGNIHRWNPGVVNSYLIGDQVEGVGTCRTCDLGHNNYLDEKVVAWIINEQLTMRVVDTNLAFEHADIRFTLVPERQNTRVIVSPDYQLKYGLLGRLLDTIYVRRTYRRGMQLLLVGLKEYVENGGYRKGWRVTRLS
jgi:uncharacterized protein YndB with AHSA1/START domain